MKPLSYSTIILIYCKILGPHGSTDDDSSILKCYAVLTGTDVSKEHGYKGQSHFTFLQVPLEHCQVHSTHVSSGSESQTAWIYLMHPFPVKYTHLWLLHPEDEGTPETSVTIHKMIWCNTAADLKIHIYHHKWIPFAEMAQFSIFEDSDPWTMLLTHNPKYLKQFSQHKSHLNECKINLMVERCCNAVKCVTTNDNFKIKFT